jgi:hypothetical protein
VSDYVDQEKMCRDCPEKFVFTAGEQAFFAEKQFNPPTRCPSCRAKRKAAAAGQGFNPGAVQHRAAPAPEVYRSQPRHEPAPEMPSRPRKQHKGSRRRHEMDEDRDW